MRRQTLIGLMLIAAAACGGDATAPPVLTKTGRTAKVRPIESPSFTISSYDYKIPTFVAPTGNEGAECYYRLQQTQFKYIDQTQSLVWTTTTLRAGHDTVAKGRFQIRYRSYDGTYLGQPLQCVKIDQMYFYGTLNTPLATAQPKAEFWQDPTADGFNWCYGTTQCANYPAVVFAYTYKRWNWRCNVDVSVSNCMQSIELGGVPSLGNGGLWKVAIYARPNGWWTVWDYGGNNGLDTGYWQWDTTGYYLQGTYYYSSTPNYNWYRAGTTHWTLQG